MTKKLNLQQTLVIGSMLFGLFFGAGNVIFPLEIGQAAGSNLWLGGIGFLITATGLPLLAVNAQGVTQKEDLLALSSSIQPLFGWWYTLLVYLTIGPLFAIPRLATVSYEIGLSPWVSQQLSGWALLGFSIIFFGIVYVFSLKPGKLMDVIGKVLNPLFLAFVIILFGVALFRPLGQVSNLVALESYKDFPITSGFQAGYQTMDAIAGLAFGILVVRSIQSYGLTQPKEISRSVLMSGLASTILMAAVYLSLIYLGAVHRTDFPMATNGGQILANLINHYFGIFGGVFLFIVITLACIKTGIGLVTACAETAEQLFPGKLKYSHWVLLVTLISLSIANIGLETIIQLSLPVLAFLYPYTISLIILANLSPLFKHGSNVYLMSFAFILLYHLLTFVLNFLGMDGLLAAYWPFYAAGLGWTLPALIGALWGWIRTFSSNLL